VCRPSYAASKDKKMITVAINQFKNELDPVKAYNFHQFILIQCVMDTMLHLDEAGNISSEVIKKWDVSNDRKTYTFEIDSKFKFHNDESITSSDVAYSLSRHLWESSGSIVKQYLEQIEGFSSLREGQFPKGIKIISDYKFSITLKRPSPSFLYALTMPSFSIISSKEMKKGNLVSSGRMTLAPNKEKGYTLTAWGKYVGKRPQLEEIKLVEFVDSKTVAKKVEKGEVDLAIGLSTDVAASIKSDNIVKDTVKTLSYNHLFYNTRKKIFKDSNFRADLTAILQTIAKESAKNTDFLDFQPYYFPKGIMPPSYYERKLKAISEIDFAKKWKKSLDQESITIVLLENVYPSAFIDNLEKTFEKNKLNIKIKKIKTGYTQSLENRDYDVVTGLYMGNFPDPDGFIEPLKQGQKYSYGVMPITDDLTKITDINAIEDKYDRLKKYSELFLKIEENNFFAPLFKDKIPLIYNKKLRVTNSAYRYESELWKIFWRD
jgi:ABC-type oligopeptide transport system substrate-binding subunit